MKHLKDIFVLLFFAAALTFGIMLFLFIVSLILDIMKGLGML